MVDNEQLLEEVLKVLRSRLADDALDRATELQRLLCERHPELAEAPVSVVRAMSRRIITDIVKFEMIGHELQPATLLMIGLETSGSSRRLTRKSILHEMKRVIPARTARSGPYTPRWIEVLERREIGPLVMRHLVADPDFTSSLPLDSWGEVAIRYTLRPRFERPDLVVLRYELSFTSNRRNLLVAVTTDEILADGLCDKYPEIAEVFVPSVGEAENVHIFSGRVLGDVGHSQLNTTVAKPSSLPDSLRALKLREPDLYLYRLSPPVEPGGARRRYTLGSDQNIDLREGYCYWTAPRRLKLINLIVDYAAFPNFEEYEFFFRPRFGADAMPAVGMETGQVTIDTALQLEKGNGFELKWRHKAC